RGLRSRKIVVVNGPEGVGKSFGAEAWCEQHLGEARFIRPKGIVNKTTLFQSISQACGLSSGVQQKSQEMQTRIEKFLDRAGIMLVIDEAHRLFPQSERMSAHPEMMNWVYTLWDMQIPVALLTTPQFIHFMDHAERKTGWNSGQFKRRVEKWEQLPDRIGEEDLRAVACKLAPCFTKAMIGELVDFALPARRQLDALKRALSAAELFASEAGRQTPNPRDLDEGIKDADATDFALTTPLDKQRQAGIRAGRPRRRRSASAGARQPPGQSDAELSPPDLAGTDFADRTSAPPRSSAPASPRATRPGLAVA
ncbi:MAG: AAA family ATPase, partial [Gammaproteobacteria bacterium]